MISRGWLKEWFAKLTFYLRACLCVEISYFVVTSYHTEIKKMLRETQIPK
jgi:hypothetical protein